MALAQNKLFALASSTIGDWFTRTQDPLPSRLPYFVSCRDFKPEPAERSTDLLGGTAVITEGTIARKHTVFIG